MKFSYTEIPNKQDPTRPFQRPYLIVRLVYGTGHKDVVTLIDSGADLCLFHADVGRMLGIDIQTGRKCKFQGVAGGKEVAYLHYVRLIVRGLGDVNLEVGFTDSMAVGSGLLGQQGFFEQLQISFHLYKKFFEVAAPNP
ncbi:MAG: retropepsin-like domain-containing protein [Acidobacteriota bacterium]|nr:retropepsin-like domain-containing protein [Acidobacteriota bacterium]